MKRSSPVRRWVSILCLVVGGVSVSACSDQENGETVASVEQKVEAEWAPNTPYTVGTTVTFGARRYRVTQQHVSQAGWPPPQVPALFEEDGPILDVLPAVVFPASCDDDPALCCPEGTAVLALTDGDDTQQILLQQQCLVTLRGRDTLHVSSAEPATVLAGFGDDTVMGGPQSDSFLGGPGNDTLYGYEGQNALFGGPGDDTIFAGNGGNRVVPGPGRDVVTTGTGNDIVSIFDVCEIESGESLSGGSGEDTLVSPVPLEELTALGVVVSGFEHVRVERNSCRSECVERPACGLGEVCAEGAEPGQVVCRPEDSSSGSEHHTLAVYLPRGEKFPDVALGARRHLTLAANAIVDLGAQHATVAHGDAELGEAARASTLVARDGAQLAASAVVTGDLRSTQASVLNATANVAGSLQSGQTLSPPETLRLHLVFPPPREGDVRIVSGRSRILWAGNYGNLRVENGGKVYLQSGRYRFQSLRMDAGSELFIESAEGVVRVDVAAATELRGRVRHLGPGQENFLLVSATTSAVSVSGSFHGTLLAPSGLVDFVDGNHEGFFYGDRVQVAAGTLLTGRPRPWDDLIPPQTEPTAVRSSGVNGGRISATTSQPGTYSKPGGFDLRLRERLPISRGNAGNHAAMLTYSNQFGTHSCTYLGGAGVAHPTTMRERALGAEYHFQACSDGHVAGDVVRVDSVQLSLDGDDLDPGGATGVDWAVGESCNGALPAPMSKGESRTRIESFVWPQFSPPPVDGVLSEPLVVQGRVQERTADGRPALYSAQIYIRNRVELTRLDQFLIHWSKRPVFLNEWPLDWEGNCGTIGFDHDGEGMWVYAVLPGVTYNAIRDARNHEDIAEDQREAFRAIRLVLPPEPARTEWGSLRLDVLAQTGFRYLGLRELPDDAAVDSALYRGGAVDALVDIAEFVVDGVRDVIRETVVFFGTIDSIWGTVDVYIDTTASKLDTNFDTYANGRMIPMRAPWRGAEPNEIASRDIRVTMYNVVQRVTTLGAPVPVKFTNKLSDRGAVLLKVSKDDDASGVAFEQLCYELQNEAASVTSFLIPDEVCDGSKSGVDFRSFRENSVVQFDTDNRDLVLHAEATDAFDYLQEVVGVTAPQVKVMRGPTAFQLSGYAESAWAPCLGIGDGLVDTGVGLLSNSGLIFPPAAPLGLLSGGYLAALSDSDIVITPNHYTHTTRGVMAHEYGHFALCAMVRENGEGALEKAQLTFDTVAAGYGDPTPDKEVRVVNEAFADFLQGKS